MQTEMLSMSLTGESEVLGTITVEAGAQLGHPQSFGGITEVPGGGTFHSFFDVWPQLSLSNTALSIQGQRIVSLTAQTVEVQRLEAVITEIPPFHQPYKKVAEVVTFVVIEVNGQGISGLEITIERIIHELDDDPPVPQKRAVKKLTTSWGKIKSDRST